MYRKMKFDPFEETVRYQKIRKRKKSSQSFLETEYQSLADTLTPAGIHTVEDRIVRFDEKRRETFKEGGRPGVITRAPDYHTRWQTRWVPFSTKTDNRNPDQVVYLNKETDNVTEDCVALPFFSQSFHCKTFTQRTGKLQNEKFAAIVSIEQRGILYDEF